MKTSQISNMLSLQKSKYGTNPSIWKNMKGLALGMKDHAETGNELEVGFA